MLLRGDVAEGVLPVLVGLEHTIETGNDAVRVTPAHLVRSTGRAASGFARPMWSVDDAGPSFGWLYGAKHVKLIVFIFCTEDGVVHSTLTLIQTRRHRRQGSPEISTSYDV